LWLTLTFTVAKVGRRSREIARDRVEIASRSRRNRGEIAQIAPGRVREGPMLLADSAAARHVAGWHGIIAEA